MSNNGYSNGNQKTERVYLLCNFKDQACLEADTLLRSAGFDVFATPVALAEPELKVGNTLYRGLRRIREFVEESKQPNT
jgi:hypothetical protein